MSEFFDIFLDNLWLVAEYAFMGFVWLMLIITVVMAFCAIVWCMLMVFLSVLNVISVILFRKEPFTKFLENLQPKSSGGRFSNWCTRF